MNAEVVYSERCPQDQEHEPLIQRVAGLWCPICRGWVVEIVTPRGSKNRHVMVEVTRGKLS